jgi:hypothetical protein
LSKQLVGLAQTRRRVEAHLGELDRLLAGGRHRMKTPADLQRRVDEALSPRWMRQLYRTTVAGADHDSLTLEWSFDPDALAALTDRELGKRILFTDRHHWPTAELVRAYRCQAQIEAAFRQTGDPDHAAFRPVRHWTDQKVLVHGAYTTLALILVHLAWRCARQAGLDLSAEQVLDTLAAIREVTLLYPPARGQGKPRLIRKLTRMDQTQQALFELFNLDHYAPAEGNTAGWRGY